MAIRFPLQAPIAFWWTDESGNRQQYEGLSRDLSDRGAFVFATVCPPVGTNVGFRISLEDLPDVIGTFPIEVEGKVLRVERPATGKGSCGFAVLRRLS
jgi:hypothetical protein